MKPVHIVGIALLASLVGGIVGGVVGRMSVLPQKEPLPTRFDELQIGQLTVEQVRAGTIDFKELVSADNEKTHFRASGGTLETAGLLRCASAAIGFRLQVPTVVSRDIQVVTNPLEPDPKQLKLYGQIAATRAGGAVSMRNAKGAFISENGQAKDGMMLYMGYDSNEAPILYTTELGKEKPQKILIYHPAVMDSHQKTQGENTKTP